MNRLVGARDLEALMSTKSILCDSPIQHPVGVLRTYRRHCLSELARGLLGDSFLRDEHPGKLCRGTPRHATRSSSGSNRVGSSVVAHLPVAVVSVRRRRGRDMRIHPPFYLTYLSMSMRLSPLLKARIAHGRDYGDCLFAAAEMRRYMLSVLGNEHEDILA